MESKSAGSPRQELMEQPNLGAYIHDNRERFPDGVLSLLSEIIHLI